MPDINVMIDLETLSIKPNSVIVSIGACKFDLENGITDEFKINVCPKSCKELGMDIMPSTIDWWKKQSKEAQNAWRVDPRPIQEALNKFKDWYGSTSIPVWGNGAAFDIPILETAFWATDIQIPWKYWDVMCARSVFKLQGIDLKKQREGRTDLVYHDSLSDAKFQAEELMKLFGFAK